MPKSGLLTAAVIAILAAGPTTALASSHASKATSPIALATSIAGRWWGSVPCGGRIKILTQQAVPANVQRDADAWATFNSSLGANNLTAPATSYTNCAVHLGRYRWPTTASMRQDWDMLCMTMTHEFGHLLGHPHNTAPGSVMNPVFTNYRSEPQLCRTDRPARSGPAAA
jgi:Matrixin